MKLAVCGAHLKGFPLHHQLEERDAKLIWQGNTSSNYRFFALLDSAIPKPGLIREERGHSIYVEVYELPSSEVGSFLDAIPFPLGLGKVELENGDWVTGFVCDRVQALAGEEISIYGSWKTYLETKKG